MSKRNKNKPKDVKPLPSIERNPPSLIRLLNGECLELMKTLDSKSINLILCDLPYGTTECKWDSVIPFDKLWSEYERVIKDNGAIVLFGAEPFSSKLRLSNPEMYRYDWKWEKSKATGFLNSKKRPLISHEDILVFYKNQCLYNPQMAAGDPYNKGFRDSQTGVYGKQWNYKNSNTNGQRYPRSVQYFKTAESEGKTFHPTQKPTKLLEYLIKTYTNEGMLVLDNTMGSGSTGVAAINTGRNFIGIEMDKGYFKIACKRIDKAKNKT